MVPSRIGKLVTNFGRKFRKIVMIMIIISVTARKSIIILVVIPKKVVS